MALIGAGAGCYQLRRPPAQPRGKTDADIVAVGHQQVSFPRAGDFLLAPFLVTSALILQLRTSSSQAMRSVCCEWGLGLITQWWLRSTVFDAVQLKQLFGFCGTVKRAEIVGVGGHYALVEYKKEEVRWPSASLYPPHMPYSPSVCVKGKFPGFDCCLCQIQLSR